MRDTNRRQFLKQTAMSAALGLCLGSSGCAADILSNSKIGLRNGKTPNVLFIPVDDLRIQLGCYGQKEIISPNIDRLASQGTLFNRAYCQFPVCGPSRVSVMNSIRNVAGKWSTGELNMRLKSLPGLFKEHGYDAISNGKVYHHMHDDESSWSQVPWRDVPIFHAPGDWARYNTYGLWQNPDSSRHMNPDSGRGPYFDCADVPDDHYQDGKLAQKTISDLRQCKETGKPFFMACGFWRPHLPFNAPKKYWDLYKREDIEIADNRYKPKNLPSRCRQGDEIFRYGLVAGRTNNVDFHREARHGYYACVSYVDAQIGLVLDELERLGLADDTIVILWGDNGWHLGEHTFWGKQNTLNNTFQVPLIIRAPGFKKNNKTDALVEFVDIYPSLCELAGIPIPKQQVEGTSFVPLMTDPKRPWKSAVFSAYYEGAKAVMTDRYLYVQWSDSCMLFDHQTDADENVNVAEQQEYADVVAQINKLIKEKFV